LSTVFIESFLFLPITVGNSLAGPVIFDIFADPLLKFAAFGRFVDAPDVVVIGQVVINAQRGLAEADRPHVFLVDLEPSRSHDPGPGEDDQGVGFGQNHVA